jgi:5-oxopent-3-ene-1,2,5-tricarboxylate decarboxylase/2-hydroxyhepta-2,4-diene-1,7-dioate isomerase
MSALPAVRTVYGTLLNSRAELEAWAPRMNEAPYKGAPRAPVLYIKPANTWNPDGADVVVPARIAEVEIGATVGMVMKSPGVVGGYVLMNDFSVPHASYFRPPVKFKCLDGFLGVGQVVDGAGIDPMRIAIEVRVNGALRQTVRFDDLVRAPSQLLADVSEFMTLGSGDVLMLGLGADRPRAHPGDTVELRAEGLGILTHKLVGTP